MKILALITASVCPFGQGGKAAVQKALSTDNRRSSAFRFAPYAESADQCPSPEGPSLGRYPDDPNRI